MPNLTQKRELYFFRTFQILYFFGIFLNSDILVSYKAWDNQVQLIETKYVPNPDQTDELLPKIENLENLKFS